MNRAEFDVFSRDYTRLLASQLRFFDAADEYFAEYKAKLARQLVRRQPRTVLDFGCGIGRSVKFLQRHFPESVVIGTDISGESLEVARSENPGVEFRSVTQLPAELKADLIFVTGVLHHMGPEERVETARFWAERLSDAGEVVVFEHNPYNPVTRRIVRDCPFDRDAQLVTRAEVVRLLKAAGFDVRRCSYTLFFPAALRRLRWLESYLGAVPLGGQYLVHAARPVLSDI